MAKNILIGFLLALLVLAGILIGRDLLGGQRDAIERTEDVGPTEGEELSTEHEREAEQDSEREISITGEWQSDDDPQSSVTFRANGTLVDSYGGGVINEEGVYFLFDTPNDLPDYIDDRPEGTFMRQTFGDEDYYYHVRTLTDSSLELLYLSGRGQALRYTRVRP